MKVLVPTTQFKKDLKKYSNNPSRMEELRQVLDMLKNEASIPSDKRPHPLKGQYKGCMECHIGSDFLLIWIDGDVISLVRLGTHSELFGKKR